MNSLQKENDILAYTNLISRKVQIIEDFQKELVALTKVRNRLINDSEATLESISKEEGFLSHEELLSLSRVVMEMTLSRMLESVQTLENNEDLLEKPVNGSGEFLN